MTGGSLNLTATRNGTRCNKYKSTNYIFKKVYKRHTNFGKTVEQSLLTPVIWRYK